MGAGNASTWLQKNLKAKAAKEGVINTTETGDCRKLLSPVELEPQQEGGNKVSKRHTPRRSRSLWGGGQLLSLLLQLLVPNWYPRGPWPLMVTSNCPPDLLLLDVLKTATGQRHPSLPERAPGAETEEQWPSSVPTSFLHFYPCFTV